MIAYPQNFSLIIFDMDIGCMRESTIFLKHPLCQTLLNSQCFEIDDQRRCKDDCIPHYLQLIVPTIVFFNIQILTLLYEPPFWNDVRKIHLKNRL